MFYKLNGGQIDKLADISSDVALVSLASVVIPALFDKLNPILVGLGLLATVAFWIISLWLKK